MFGQFLHGCAQDFMPLHALRTALLKTDQHLAPGSHSRHAFRIGVDSERGVVFQYLRHEWMLCDERDRPIGDGTAGESLVGRGFRDPIRPVGRGGQQTLRQAQQRCRIERFRRLEHPHCILRRVRTGIWLEAFAVGQSGQRRKPRNEKIIATPHGDEPRKIGHRPRLRGRDEGIVELAPVRTENGVLAGTRLSEKLALVHPMRMQKLELLIDA